MKAIIFSRDRALQLDACLRAFRAHVPRLTPTVLYRATSPRHQWAYDQVFAFAGAGVTAYQQGHDFKRDVLALLPTQGEVVFFVDDQIFVRGWNGRGPAGLSLRLGQNLTANYASGDTSQPLPSFLIDWPWLRWRWADGQLAWAYPLSLDGHVFDVADIRPKIEAIPFGSPNTLEAGLQVFLPEYLRRDGSCYPHSLVVNVPWTRVQQDCDNRSEGLDPETFLGYWADGWQINLRGIRDVQSVHQVYPLVLERREAEVIPAHVKTLRSGALDLRQW